MDISIIIFSIFGLSILLSIAAFILWIWMLVHAITKISGDTQILWIVLMIVLGPLASIIYYFVIKRPMDAKPYTGTTVPGITSFK